jgi:hypothetical protein
MVGIVCERLAEDRHCDVNASIEFHDGIVRPKNLPYFMAGNNFALPLHQDSQNLEGLLAEQGLCGPSFRSRRSDGDEFTGSDVELKRSKSGSLGQIGRVIHGVAAKLPSSVTSHRRLTHSSAKK